MSCFRSIPSYVTILFEPVRQAVCLGPFHLRTMSVRCASLPPRPGSTWTWSNSCLPDDAVAAFDDHDKNQMLRVTQAPVSEEDRNLVEISNHKLNDGEGSPSAHAALTTKELQKETIVRVAPGIYIYVFR